ncbi:MAG: peptide-methionine (R)-S-oxide reductase MsrB [Bacilli bacterium]|jgi:peptide methionine sulfoxide reductase msrA/msrB
MRKTIYLAGGCFWGIEGYFKRLRGVIDTEVGYANGNSEDTFYCLLKETKHAETVKITYDTNIIRTAELIDRFFMIIDPFSLNEQGNDEGEQYRTGVFYEKDDNYTKTIALLFKDYVEKTNNKESYVVIEPLRHFIKAEDYHQDYLDKNPNGYCHINLALASENITSFTKLTSKEIKLLNLSVISLDVMLNKGTERPFTSEYNDNDEVGLYIDKISKEPLFSSEDKYDAGCGWPSFTRPLISNGVNYSDDYSIPSRPRTEVTSSVQTSHLGHVFDDGPSSKGGLRYCINGCSLDFIPLNKLKGTVYEKYMFYFDKYINEHLEYYKN